MLCNFNIIFDSVRDFTSLVSHVSQIWQLSITTACKHGVIMWYLYHTDFNPFWLKKIYSSPVVCHSQSLPFVIKRILRKKDSVRRNWWPFYRTHFSTDFKSRDSLFHTTFTIHDVTYVNEVVCAICEIRVGTSFLFWFCDKLAISKMATIRKAWLSAQKMIVKIDLFLL